MALTELSATIRLIGSDLTSSALTLRNVAKTFNPGQWNEVAAVREVSAEFQWGESILIIGDNGSGKSTLLNLVDGTVDLTSGSITMAGLDVSSWPTHRRFQHLHRIHQDPSCGMAPFGSIAENLAVLDLARPRLWSFGSLRRAAGSTQLAEAVSRINPDLAGHLDRKVYRLSPGQRQSVALAMLAMRTDQRRILLADEPTAALDPPTAAICLHMIQQKAQQGWLVLHITHNPAIISAHDGRVVTMQEGKVIADVPG